MNDGPQAAAFRGARVRLQLFGSQRYTVALRGPADCSAEIRAMRASVLDLLERARRDCSPLRVALEDIASRIPGV